MKRAYRVMGVAMALTSLRGMYTRVYADALPSMHTMSSYASYSEQQWRGVFDDLYRRAQAAYCYQEGSMQDVMGLWGSVHQAFAEVVREHAASEHDLYLELSRAITGFLTLMYDDVSTSELDDKRGSLLELTSAINMQQKKAQSQSGSKAKKDQRLKVIRILRYMTDSLIELQLCRASSDRSKLASQVKNILGA